MTAHLFDCQYTSLSLPPLGSGLSLLSPHKLLVSLSHAGGREGASAQAYTGPVDTKLKHRRAMLKHRRADPDRGVDKRGERVTACG